MKFYKYCLGLIVGVVLTATPIGSELFDKETDMNLINTALPALTGLVGMCVAAVPVGPLLVAGLSLIHIASVIMYGGEEGDVARALTNVDLMKFRTEMLSEVKKVDSHILEESERIIRELTHTVQSHPFFEDMRNTMEFLLRTTSDETEVVLDPKITGLQKNSTMLLMQDPHSTFRDSLRFFVSKFIKPKINMPLTGPVKLFFDYVLEKDRLLAIDNIDSHTDSIHSQVLKSYMFIAKILTDAYVLPIAAEAIQYQGELKDGRFSDANSTKRDSLKLINEYKNDMKALIDTVKSALDKASREIRNSGTFELIEGKTIERLAFAHTIPRIFTISTSGCLERENFINSNIFKTGNCNSHGDLIPGNSRVSIFKNPKDLERPYQYITSKVSDEDEQIFGHKISETGLVKDTVTTDDRCPTVFCSVFKKKAVGISTQRVRAEIGNVITGIRFRVEKGILYIDIQQGKFLDILSVDPKTVYWTKTPAGGPVTYLSSGVRKLELGNFNLPENDFLTSIQFKQGLQRDGFVFVFVEGGNAPSWNNFPEGSLTRIPKSGELKIDGDDPINAPLKNLISKAPEKSDRYFVRFQQSNFEKDLGRSTIPYIDIREVVSNPPAPMNGFGIYHQSGDGSGGIISLKLITPSLSKFVNFDQIEKFTEAAKKVL